MGNATHTPGPWTIEDPFGDDSLAIVIGEQTYDWRFVATVHMDLEKGGAVKPIGKAQMEANARLIAAAPETEAERDALLVVNAEMLEALKAQVAYDDSEAGIGDQLSLHIRAKTLITVAIAKAEGGL